MRKHHWAIRASILDDLREYWIGPFWFTSSLPAWQDCRTALFPTRKIALEHLGKVRTAFPKATVLKVFVNLEVAR